MESRYNPRCNTSKGMHFVVVASMLIWAAAKQRSEAHNETGGLKELKAALKWTCKMLSTTLEIKHVRETAPMRKFQPLSFDIYFFCFLIWSLSLALAFPPTLLFPLPSDASPLALFPAQTDTNPQAPATRYSKYLPCYIPQHVRTVSSFFWNKLNNRAMGNS